MALTNIKQIELHYMDIWFTNLVDSMNFNIGQIEDQVAALDKVLVTLDTSPIQYLRKSFTELVDGINSNFKDIEARLSKLEK